MLGVLHTWSRTLIFHPHIHYLIPGGGLSLDGRTWVAARQQFLLHHLSRYIFKTATSNRPVQLLPQGKLRWTYRESKTRKFTSLKLDPLEFMTRFLQHTLPRGFARVGTFGWLHPAAKVRALLREKPLLTPAEKQTWNPPSPPTLQPPPPVASPAPGTPRCPCCQLAMRPHWLLARRTGSAPTSPTTLTRALRISRLPQKRNLRCERDRLVQAPGFASHRQFLDTGPPASSRRNHSTPQSPGSGNPAGSGCDRGKRRRQPILSAKSPSSINTL